MRMRLGGCYSLSDGAATSPPAAASSELAAAAAAGASLYETLTMAGLSSLSPMTKPLRNSSSTVPSGTSSLASRMMASCRLGSKGEPTPGGRGGGSARAW